MFSGVRLITFSEPIMLVVMVLLLVTGFYLMFASMKLFASVSHGSPAPWNPINRLITKGIYAYMRNPMLCGVFLVLGAESLFFKSLPLFFYDVIFIAVNVVYFICYEEKELIKRYGKDYEIYKANVPRFIPKVSLRTKK